LSDFGSIEIPQDVIKTGGDKLVLNGGQAPGILGMTFAGIVCMAILMTDVCGPQK
jgi:hypothetical protein